MSLDDAIENEPFMFKLVDKSPDRLDTAVYIQTPHKENKDMWTSQIKAMLDMQGDFLRGKPMW